MTELLVEVILSDMERDQLVETAKFLNGHFKTDSPAYSVVEQIKAFPRPIAVDFNNVLVDSNGKLVNPEAPDFLFSLREMGNVFIVTAASNWGSIYQRLKDNQLWFDDTVLLCLNNWNFLVYYDPDNQYGLSTKLETSQLIDQYLSVIQNTMPSIKYPDFVHRAAAHKPVAPLFGKNFLVPLIDDSSWSTQSNPGILGIKVKYFEPNPKISHNNGGCELSEAVEIVRKHYSMELDH